MTLPDERANKVLVSSSRKPTVYIGVCQKILGEYGEVRLSGLGVAMSSLVTVAEILKSRGLVTEKNIITSLEELDSDDGSGKRKKPKLEIILEKTANFEELVAKEAAERAAKRENAVREENVE
jgi:DNA-binding protein